MSHQTITIAAPEVTMSETQALCPASGTMLPDDVKADYLADPSCTHFHCAHCNKLLALPKSPYGLVRKHTLPKDEGEKWPYGNGVEPPPDDSTVH